MDPEPQDRKENNRETYRVKSKKYKKGERPPSPWYYLENRYLRGLLEKQDTREDFTINDRYIKIIKN
jgi:hypothetical protein